MPQRTRKNVPLLLKLYLRYWYGRSKAQGLTAVARNTGLNYFITKHFLRLAQSVEQLATDWAVRGSNPGGGKISLMRPDQPWDQPSLLYNGYRVYCPGYGINNPPHLAQRLRKAKSYTSTSSGPSGPVLE